MSARETLLDAVAFSDARRTNHVGVPVTAIRTVLAELEQAEREISEMVSPTALANALDKVRLADQERDRAVRASKELIEAQGFQFKRAEQAERERDDARECSTLMERERDAARGRAADAEARIANNVRAYSAELESRTVALQQAEARIAALIEAGDRLLWYVEQLELLAYDPSEDDKHEVVQAWEKAKGGAK